MIDLDAAYSSVKPSQVLVAPKSDEISRELAKKIGGGMDAEFAWKATITAKTGGGVEWKDGQTHTSATAAKLKIAYYKIAC